MKETAYISEPNCRELPPGLFVRFPQAAIEVQNPAAVFEAKVSVLRRAHGAGTVSGLN